MVSHDALAVCINQFRIDRLHREHRGIGGRWSPAFGDRRSLLYQLAIISAAIAGLTIMMARAAVDGLGVVFDP
jgi:hypothetical protein